MAESSLLGGYALITLVSLVLIPPLGILLFLFGLVIAYAVIKG